MKEVFGNIWEYYNGNILCVPTNGYVTFKGYCVMGRGVAYEVKQRCQSIEYLIGDLITKHGNRVFIIDNSTLKASEGDWDVEHYISLVTFPTKHSWKEISDLELIRKSSESLSELANSMPYNIFVLPRPGCGNGGLKWEDVKPVIENILPDNVHVITYK